MNKTKTNPEKLTLAGKRIGVFGKGGSGKSTVVVLLAGGLRERGYEVCILDADSTNLGIPQVLGIDQPPQSLMEYFGGMVFSGGLVTCPVDDPTRLPDSEISLDELPPEYHCQSPQGIKLLVAGKIGDQGPGAGCDGPVSKIARDLNVIDRGKAPVTLVDFKAGFEDTARGVITGLDWAIVIVDPTIAAVEMAENMKDTVDQIKNGRLPATRHIEDPILIEIANQIFTQACIKGTLFVLNKIPDKEVQNYLETKLAERGIEPNGVIHVHPSISLSWLKGRPLQIPEARDEVLQIIQELEAAESAYSASGKRQEHKELLRG
jgi:CO dehydrogenase nickel-insertion accessory protein CooC1